MPDRLERLRRIEESVKTAIQDRLLGSLSGDGRYENGVSTSLPAPARRTIQSAGVAPPEISLHRFERGPDATASGSAVAPVPPTILRDERLQTPASSTESKEAPDPDPERDMLERLIARLGDRESTTVAVPPMEDRPETMSLEQAQHFMRELEAQPRDRDDGGEQPHAEVSF